jgi:anti-sigma regulatory factor (Ser/Thr protein kinase)
MNTSASDREQRSFGSVPTSARAARQFVTDLLRQHGATPAEVNDCALVISELVTNIIEHGDGSPLVIVLDASDPAWWDIEVTSGVASDVPQLVLQPETWTVAGAEDVSGRGLGIVHHLMDHVTTDSTGGQLIVRCRRRRSEL